MTSVIVYGRSNPLGSLWSRGGAADERSEPALEDSDPKGYRGGSVLTSTGGSILTSA